MEEQQPQRQGGFENVATASIQAQPSQIIKLLILEDRYYLREAIERYIINKFRYGTSGQAEIAFIRGRINSLIFDIRHFLKEDYTDQQLKGLLKMQDGTIDDLLGLVDTLNDYLNKKGFFGREPKKKKTNLIGEENNG